jgi:hypothetical protein
MLCFEKYLSLGNTKILDQKTSKKQMVRGKKEARCPDSGRRGFREGGHGTVSIGKGQIRRVLDRFGSLPLLLAEESIVETLLSLSHKSKVIPGTPHVVFGNSRVFVLHIGSAGIIIMVRTECIGRSNPILMEDCENGNLPFFEKIPSFSSLPMVDHITLGSDSSSSDISSVSSDEAEDDLDENDLCCHTPKTKPLAPVTPPRSIFGRYWEKNPGAVVDPFETLKMLSMSSPPEEDDSASCNTYERTLQRRPFPTTSPALPRRCIFPNASLNLPALAERTPSRKAHSDSRLLKEHRASCLRPSRFARHGSSSSSSEDLFSSSSSVVSFSPKVDVIVFRRPVEHWAAKGWSEYFA